MVNVKDKDEQVAGVKAALIKVLGVQSLDYHTILLRGSFSTGDISTIGNCLRVLKKQEYIKDELIDGVRFWSRTDKKFDENPPVKVLVPFSADTHQRISEIAEKKGTSRVSVIRSLVESSLKTL